MNKAIIITIIGVLMLSEGISAIWWDSSYAYKMPLNCTNMSDEIPFVVNGSSGFNSLHGLTCGQNQIVWTYCSGTGTSLYYNNCTNYVVANDTIQLPFEVEEGNVSSLTWIKTNITDFNRIGLYEESNPVIPCGNSSASDHHIRELGNILYEPSEESRKYKTFYTGWNVGSTVDEKIHYAYSEDGKTWTKSTSNPVIDARRAEDPYVVKNGSTYYLYAEDKQAGGDNKIRKWNSTDCETWVDDGQITLATEAQSPTVWIEDSTWYMLYEKFPSDKDTRLATSSDGMTWTDDPSNPVFNSSDIDWVPSGLAVVPDDIIKRNNIYHLFFHASTGDADTGNLIRGGRATSTDLTNWADSGTHISANEGEIGTELRNAQIFNDTEDVFLYTGRKQVDSIGIYRGYPIKLNTTVPWGVSETMILHLSEKALNNTNYDSSIYHNDAAERISPPGTQDATGKYNGADYFDGVDDFIDVAGAGSIQFEATDNFSISFWMKPEIDYNQATDNIYLISHKYSGDGWFICGFSGQVGIRFATGYGNIKVGSAIWNKDQWYYLVLTHNESATSEDSWFLDGAINATDNANYGGFDETSINIGKRKYSLGADGYFNGTIDEVRLYNRTLSASEINQIYQNAIGTLGFGTLETEESAADCNCSTCDDCEEKLNDASCPLVTLNTSISDYSGTCIDNPENISNKIFDCQEHIIDGDDTGYYYGINATKKNNVTIKNCIITDFNWGVGLLETNNSLINNNTISSNLDEGIRLDDNENCRVNDNIIANTGLHAIVTDGDNHNITNNILSSNGQNGIILSGSTGVLVTGNMVTNNGYHGISMGPPSISGNILNNNTLCNNNQSGGNYYDIQDAGTNSGDNNTCDTTSNWDDTGTYGCTYLCSGHTCGGGLTTNSTLSGNIQCNGHAFWWGADRVMLNCSRYTISGNGTGYGLYMGAVDQPGIVECYMPTNFATNILINGSSNTRLNFSATTAEINFTYCNENTKLISITMLKERGLCGKNVKGIKTIGIDTGICLFELRGDTDHCTDAETEEARGLSTGQKIAGGFLGVSAIFASIYTIIRYRRRR